MKIQGIAGKLSQEGYANQQASQPLTKLEASETNSGNFMENNIVDCRECPDYCAFLEGKDYEWCSCYNFFKEYNTDTSAGHPVKDDDIVRYSEETQRVQDKELEYN